MTWFKVDDKAWSHPKLLRLSSAAFGVWARVGSYCSDHLTDGVVDLDTVYAICPDPKRTLDKAVDELVNARLWELIEDGWQYHDWHDHQPTREGVMAKRQAAAERVRRWREKRQAEMAAMDP